MPEGTCAFFSFRLELPSHSSHPCSLHQRPLLPVAIAMPRKPEINDAIAEHLETFRHELIALELLPAQGSHDVNEKKNTFYANTTRSVVCAFGWPNTLKQTVKVTPEEWDYEHIPALPPLADDMSDVDDPHASQEESSDDGADGAPKAKSSPKSLFEQRKNDIEQYNKVRAHRS